jgi:TonB family protein
MKNQLKPSRALLFLCIMALLARSTAAFSQDAPPAAYQAEAQQAMAVIVNYFSVDATVMAGKTNKPIPLDGDWSRLNTTASCPQTKYPCVHIQYQVPALAISCEWTVLLKGNPSQGVIIDLNEDAVHYFTTQGKDGKFKPPVLEQISGKNPVYPNGAKALGDQGNIKLLVHVDSTGHVDKLTPVTGSDQLRNAATDAVKTWVFKPLVIDKVEVPVNLFVMVSFKRG